MTTKKSHCRPIQSIRAELKKAKLTLKTWRSVAKKFDISAGMAYRIAVYGYEPMRQDIRNKLGMSCMALAPTCSICGKVHILKHCPETIQPRAKKLIDMSNKEIKRLFSERKEF